jgi:hypothetical protein
MIADWSANDQTTVVALARIAGLAMLVIFCTLVRNECLH